MYWQTAQVAAQPKSMAAALQHPSSPPDGHNTSSLRAPHQCATAAGRQHSLRVMVRVKDMAPRPSGAISRATGQQLEHCQIMVHGAVAEALGDEHKRHQRDCLHGAFGLRGTRGVEQGCEGGWVGLRCRAGVGRAPGEATLQQRVRAGGKLCPSTQPAFPACEVCLPAHHAAAAACCAHLEHCEGEEEVIDVSQVPPEMACGRQAPSTGSGAVGA